MSHDQSLQTKANQRGTQVMAARKKAAAKAARKPTRKAPAKAPASAKSKLASPKSPRAATAPARKKSVKAAKAERPAARPRALKDDPQTETEALARKIVRLTSDNSTERHIAELYTDDCVSQEVDGRTT